MQRPASRSDDDITETQYVEHLNEYIHVTYSVNLYAYCFVYLLILTIRYAIALSYLTRTLVEGFLTITCRSVEDGTNSMYVS